MTETCRIRPEDCGSYTREVIAAIAEARDAGATTPDELAMALNRSGVTTWGGRQWDGERVLAFLASPDVEQLTG
ncbi:MAG: hypothetical protein QNJ94_21885 [Alphaproteobacteria bacterium]|nr:hypothetical protein [Alphaproteobacteria bacterium]